MKKIARIICGIGAAILLFCIGVLLADKHALRTQIVRLHVVAHSDRTKDQEDKLAVRDAVMQYLQDNFKDVNDINAARQMISKELPTLEYIANQTLETVGSNNSAVVTLACEEFGKREYDTFSLPSGIYESLRIQIGSGEGKNWWCVVFPSFCVPNTDESFRSTAVSSGFNQGLVETLSNDNEYELRFLLLDCLGRIENFLNIS